MTGNNTLIFSARGPLKFSDFIHTQKNGFVETLEG